MANVEPIRERKFESQLSWWFPETGSSMEAWLPRLTQNTSCWNHKYAGTYQWWFEQIIEPEFGLVDERKCTGPQCKDCYNLRIFLLGSSKGLTEYPRRIRLFKIFRAVSTTSANTPIEKIAPT